MRIIPIKGFLWSGTDRVELLRPLGKIGYRVRLGREKPSGSGQYIYYVEYDE